MTYVGASAYQPDASAILTTLPVGRAELATLLPYSPSYATATPDQRARYLDWMADGRRDASVDVGCVFIFFYGLERRVFVDEQDEDIAREDVDRLFRLFAGQSPSFRQHAVDFLAFAALRRWTQMDESSLGEQMGTFAADNSIALAGVLAWYHRHRRPLPARYASILVLASNEAKRGVALQRSSKEVSDLFALRYKKTHGEGLILDAGTRPLVIEYHPASVTLGRRKRISVKVPDVVGKHVQLASLIQIWNSCVDDLKSTSTARRRSGAVAGELTGTAWEALPPDLRGEYDHPDQERWDELLMTAEQVGRFSFTTVGNLASAAGIARSERVTSAQLRKAADTAALLGVAIEPELRVAKTTRAWTAPIVVWRSHDTECPNRDVYLPATSVLALMMAVVLADAVAVDDEELRVITRIVEDLFPLDDMLRVRLAAHREWLVREPSSALVVAKKLQQGSKPDELKRLGRLLVAVAAADGTISRAEHQALRDLFKSLGLPGADLAAAIVAADARLESDDTVVVQPATRGAKGEAIPSPPSSGPGPALNQRAIDAILADTQEVAAMLSAVLGETDGEEAAPLAPTSLVAPDLDEHYREVLEVLLARPQWSVEDVRALSIRMKLMPGAILETINTWSDTTYGDYLIDDQGDWHIRAELLRRPHA